MNNEFDFDFCLPQGEKVDISYAHWKKEAEQGDVLAKFFVDRLK